MTSSPRIIFAGTPDFAARHLQGLLEQGIQPVAVYTQPDRPAGRGRKVQKSPVKQIAEAAQIELFQPLSLRDESAQKDLASLKADLMIVVAYGLILPQAVLDLPRLGCINVHASLLPRWRGAAPIHRALLAGDSHTGITLMQMEAGLDTGPMLAKATTEIGQHESSGMLHDRLAQIGSDLLVQTLPKLFEGTLTAEKQDDSQATYAHKLEKAEGRIDWSLSADSLDRQIRGLNPWPIAYTQLDQLTVRIWRATSLGTSVQHKPGTIIELSRDGLDVATGCGVLRVTELQLPGKRAMKISDLINGQGHPLNPGNYFE